MPLEQLARNLPAVERPHRQQIDNRPVQIDLKQKAHRVFGEPRPARLMRYRKKLADIILEIVNHSRISSLLQDGSRGLDSLRSPLIDQMQDNEHQPDEEELNPRPRQRHEDSLPAIRLAVRSDRKTAKTLQHDVAAIAENLPHPDMAQFVQKNGDKDAKHP